MYPSNTTLHAKAENELANYQTQQTGNTCAFHVISAGIRLLLNHTIDPIALSDEVNRLWWKARFMRVVPNWAVTPRMQVRIVQHLARTRSLPINATFQKGDPDLLPGLLADLTSVPIITLLWRRHQAPPIYLGNTTQNFNTTLSTGGHSMLLAAYDPEHSAQGLFSTPWGFINPWMDQATHLFWMRDEDFRQAWCFWLPRVGPNPLVVIQRTISKQTQPPRE